MPCSAEEFAEIAVRLCERVAFGPQQLYRLVGVGLSNFRSDDAISSSESVLLERQAG
ncbi:MAG TPA: hypothetical protein VFA99_03810 [Acidobacteriaceae bacterium]|nr:hypothetical protein [Acidobacteriaceae bacterium]